MCLKDLRNYLQSIRWEEIRSCVKIEKLQLVCYIFCNSVKLNLTVNSETKTTIEINILGKNYEFKIITFIPHVTGFSPNSFDLFQASHPEYYNNTSGLFLFQCLLLLKCKCQVVLNTVRYMSFQLSRLRWL